VSTPSPAPPAAAPIDEARATIVYAALLAAAPLSDRHRNELHNRGLTDTEIARDGYGSLPPGNRAFIVRDVIAAVGEPVGVPGFHRRAGCWTIAGQAGLLIPMRPTGAAVTRIKIRLDRPGDGPRYTWLSTPTQDGGAGSGAVGHFAVAELRGCPRNDGGGPGVNRRLWVTEGPIKASIAARKLGEPVFAIPGVNALGPMIEALPAWRDAGVTDIVLAFDADRTTNPRVAEAHDVAAATLTAAGFTVSTASWPAAHKGIDDALVAGAAASITIERVATAAENVEQTATIARLTADLAARDATIVAQAAEIVRMSGAFVASQSAGMGMEKYTPIAIVADLARVPTGEWVAQPHARTFELTGKSSDTIARDLKRTAPLLAGFLDQELRTVKGSRHPVTFRRLTRAASECFAAISNYATPKPIAPVGEDDTIPVVIETDQRVYRADDGELLSEGTRRRTGRRPRPHADQPPTGPQLAAPLSVDGGKTVVVADRPTVPQIAALLAAPNPMHRLRRLPDERVAAAAEDHRRREAAAARRTPTPSAAGPGWNGDDPVPESTPASDAAGATNVNAPTLIPALTLVSAPVSAAPAEAHNGPERDEGRRSAVRIHDDPPRRAGAPPAFGTTGFDRWTED